MGNGKQMHITEVIRPLGPQTAVLQPPQRDFYK
jgi:hypothetical protein